MPEHVFRDAGRFALHRGAPSEAWLRAHTATPAELGGQADWFWAVPGVMRALAAPRAGELVPPAPNDAVPSPATLAYWTSLQYLLLYRLGWSKPTQGLMAWYEMGKPVDDDDTLALISAVWDADGRLDAYLGWALEKQPEYLNESSLTSATWSKYRAPLAARWEAWRVAVEPMRQRFFGTDEDPFRLTGHHGQTGTPDPAATLTPGEGRRAVYLSNTMDAWYWDLRRRARSLPGGPDDWLIDVVVRPVGFLGKYRISSESGLPFTGEYQWHGLGF